MMVEPAPPSSAATPPRAQAPTWRFLLASPWHMLALGFGSGLPRFAPGTWGTLFAWLLFARLDRWLSETAWWTLTGALLLLGAAAAQITGDRLGVADSRHIVIDEIVAFWLVLLFLPRDATHAGLLMIAAFVLFRFFDIVKPPPIRALDRRFKNGIGVMLDDLMAAFYTLLTIALVLRIWS